MSSESPTPETELALDSLEAGGKLYIGINANGTLKIQAEEIEDCGQKNVLERGGIFVQKDSEGRLTIHFSHIGSMTINGKEYWVLDDSFSLNGEDVTPTQILKIFEDQLSTLTSDPIQNLRVKLPHDYTDVTYLSTKENEELSRKRAFTQEVTYPGTPPPNPRYYTTQEVTRIEKAYQKALDNLSST